MFGQDMVVAKNPAQHRRLVTDYLIAIHRNGRISGIFGVELDGYIVAIVEGIAKDYSILLGGMQLGLNLDGLM